MAKKSPLPSSSDPELLAELSGGPPPGAGAPVGPPAGGADPVTQALDALGAAQLAIQQAMDALMGGGAPWEQR
jgi:hypothetical protein